MRPRQCADEKFDTIEKSEPESRIGSAELARKGPGITARFGGPLLLKRRCVFEGSPLL